MALRQNFGADDSAVERWCARSIEDGFDCSPDSFTVKL
jgi:hypothetical protein